MVSRKNIQATRRFIKDYVEEIRKETERVVQIGKSDPERYEEAALFALSELENEMNYVAEYLEILEYLQYN